MKMRLFSLAAFLAASLSARALTLPPGFSEETIPGTWSGIAGVMSGPNAGASKQRLYVWEAYGKVWIVEDGVKLATPLIDIGPEIGAEISLLGFTLDPSFATNGYIYLLYTVDRAVLLGSAATGRAPTIGRVTRYTCRAPDGFRTVDPASRKVLIGETASTGIPVVDRSHTMGSLQFAADGALLVSTGDGASGEGVDGGPSAAGYQAVADGIITSALNIGAFRSLSLDAMSGKILRINAATGDGVAGNPFYVPGSPRAARSRVWAYGLRNPFRFAIQPGSGSLNPADARPGTLVIGNAGWNTEDSLMVCTSGGKNFGWPRYEGFHATPGYTDLPVPAGLSADQRTPPVAGWTAEHAEVRGPSGVLPMGSPGFSVAGPDFSGKASIGGVFLNHPSWPYPWRGEYLHMDWGSDDPSSGWVRRFTSVASGFTTAVEPFGSGWQHVSHLSFDIVSGDLLAVIWPDTIKRIRPSSSPGFRADYYSGTSFDQFAFTRVETRIDQNWGTAGPGSGLTDSFSVRWTGYIRPSYTESYRLITDSDDGVRLYLNGQLVLDRWNAAPGTQWQQQTEPLPLTAGQLYEVRMEYRELTGQALAYLYWKSARQSQEPVTAVAFTPVIPSGLQTALDNLPAIGASFRADEQHIGGITLHWTAPEAAFYYLHPQVSADLVTWQAANVQQRFTEAVSSQPGFTRYSTHILLPAGARRYFFRLEAGER